MTQAEYYTTLLTFVLQAAGLAISVGFAATLIWYWWAFGRYFK